MTGRSVAIPTPAENISIVDALLRFGAGTDDGDLSVLRSAFANNAVVDFSRCGASIGLDFEPLEGADAIVGFLAGTSRRQATSHVVTNPRVRSNDGGAHLRAFVEATLACYREAVAIIGKGQVYGLPTSLLFGLDGIDCLPDQQQ